MFEISGNVNENVALHTSIISSFPQRSTSRDSSTFFTIYSPRRIRNEYLEYRIKYRKRRIECEMVRRESRIDYRQRQNFECRTDWPYISQFLFKFEKSVEKIVKSYVM